MGFFGGLADRLKQGLERSRQAMSRGLDGLLSSGRVVDEVMLEELEELLVASDLGAREASEFVSRVRAEARRTGALSGQDVRALLPQPAPHARRVRDIPHRQEASMPARPAAINVSRVAAQRRTQGAGSRLRPIPGQHQEPRVAPRGGRHRLPLDARRVCRMAAATSIPE